MPNVLYSPAHVANSRASIKGEPVCRRLEYYDNANSVFSVDENASQHIPQNART